MVPLFYNQLQSSRIRSVMLGGILAATMLAFLYYVVKGKDTMSLVMIGILFAGLFLLVTLIPYGQVVEKKSNGQVVVYQKLGPWKFKYRALGILSDVCLEQGADKNYCITIKTTTQIIVVERYPTLRDANERLSQFRAHLI